MKEIQPDTSDSFVYSCSSAEMWGYEQFVPEHVLAFQASGETHIFHQNGTLILKKGQLMLARKNQFAKSFKTPANDGEYKAFSVILKAEDLQKYAAQQQIDIAKKYEGDSNIVLASDAFLESYFQSLFPYLNHPGKGSEHMTFSKIAEAIALILNNDPSLESFLFDFVEPYKINLEAFMEKNYQYNASIENFAKLTGRSLAAFKRDFTAQFRTTPAKWLKNKRLEEAYYLIHQKNRKSADIYLDLGFENLSHFYTAFKDKYGMTPTQSLTQQK